MKKSFFIVILALMTIYLGCDKADQQEAAPAAPTTVSSNDDGDTDPGGGGNPAVGTRGCLGDYATCDITITLVSGTWDITICGILANTGTMCSDTTSCNVQAGPYEYSPPSSPYSFCASPNRPFRIKNSNGSSVVLTIDCNGYPLSSFTIPGSSSRSFTSPPMCNAAVTACP